MNIIISPKKKFLKCFFIENKELNITNKTNHKFLGTIIG